MKISQNKSVSVSYDLNVGEGDETELMEKATAETPLQFIYGTNSMLPAFEKQLDDLQEGDSFDFVLSPEEAYGEYIDENVIDLPKNIFEVDGKFDEKVVFEGATLPMMDTEGNRLQGSVISVSDAQVKMDFNHPLAGETLHFTGKVLTVKEATAEEIAALTAGGGCGCGSGGCGCGDSHDHEGGSCGCGDSHDHADGGGCGCGGSCGC